MKDGCYDAREDQSEEARPARSRQDLVGPPLISATNYPSRRPFVSPSPTTDPVVVVFFLTVRRFSTPAFQWLCGSLEFSWVPPATNKCFELLLILFLVIAGPVRSLTICSAKTGGVVIVYERKVKLLYGA